MNSYGGRYLDDDEVRALGFRSVGHDVMIHSTCVLVGLENITIGNYVRVDPFCTIVAATGKIEIGSHVHIAAYAFLSGGEGITVSDFVGMAADAHVSAWSRHDLDAAERRLAQALAANPNEPLAWLWNGITHAWRGRGDEAVQCTDRALSLSPLDPMIYYFNSLAGMANLICERYERAIELSTRSLRENRLHTPSLRTLAAALVLSGRLQEAHETICRLRELEPGLTAGALRARYPGRDSPQAGRFIDALSAAGLPP